MKLLIVSVLCAVFCTVGCQTPSVNYYIQPEVRIGDSAQPDGYAENLVPVGVGEETAVMQQRGGIVINSYLITGESPVGTKKVDANPLKEVLSGNKDALKDNTLDLPLGP